MISSWGVILYSYFMPACSIVKTISLLPRGELCDLMHYCTRPNGEWNSASGRTQHRGVIVWIYYKQA